MGESTIEFNEIQNANHKELETRKRGAIIHSFTHSFKLFTYESWLPFGANGPRDLSCQSFDLNNNNNKNQIFSINKIPL